MWHFYYWEWPDTHWRAHKVEDCDIWHYRLGSGQPIPATYFTVGSIRHSPVNLAVEE